MLRPVLFVLMLVLCRPAVAQHVPVGDPLEDYLRVLQLVRDGSNDSFTVRPISGAAYVGVHPWSEHLPSGSNDLVSPLSPVTHSFWNSERPWGQNDGAVWAGRGWTQSVSAGLLLRYGVLSVALRPLVVATQNRPFDLSRLPVRPKIAPFAYPVREDIDAPQRFGDNTFTQIFPGQSYAQLTYRGVGVGISTENMWWGPGLRNAIVMSNNAAGFPHAYVKTTKPLDIRIGKLEARWVVGSVAHSEYFVDVSDSLWADDGPSDGRRFLTGLVLTYAPRWLPGLYVGGAQTYMVKAGAPNYFGDYFAVINVPFYDGSGRHANGEDDKIVSLFARWAFPGTGFEVYGEWARGDHTSTFRDFLITPDHARGFTLGLQDVLTLSQRHYLRIGMEHTFLTANRERGPRGEQYAGFSYFYTHEGIKQGYTHRGQILGAGIGPGAQGQFVRTDLFAPFGRIGLFGVRQVFDDDLYYALRTGFGEHQVTLAGGLSWLLFYHGFELEGSLSRVKTFNRDFDFEYDTYNTNLEVTIRYAFANR